MDEAGDYLEPRPDPVFPVDCSQSNETFSRVQLLYSQHIISWPNFSECLPHCGMCQVFASDPTYIVYNLLLIGFILPMIGLCGLLGNGMSAFIYYRPEMRSSTNLYLCALGCSDSAVICTAIFLFCIDSIRRYSLHLSLLFGALSPIVYPAGMTAQTCSVYFTLVAAADCFVQVCLPDSCRKLVSSPSFVKCMVLFVIVFSVLYNVPHCFEAVVLECWHAHFQSRSLEVCPDPFRFLPSYMLIYYKYMYSIFLAVGPLVVLVALNLCIIGASIVLKKGGSSSGDTIALVLVVLLFIACNVAALLLNVFETRLGELLGPHINYIVDASNVLVVFNSSFNFVIYVTFSLPFRRTLQQHVCKRATATSTKPISQTNPKTAASTTTPAANLCTNNYSSSNKSSNSSSGSGSSSSSYSTAVIIENDDIANHNHNHHHRHHHRHCHHHHHHHRHHQPECDDQLSRKETISRLLKAARPEVLI